MRYEHSSGEKYGTLTLTGESKSFDQPCGVKSLKWKCVCDCGAEKWMSHSQLMQAKTCGNYWSHHDREEANERKKKREAKYRNDNRDEIHAKNKCTREYMKSIGICVQCQKEKAVPGMTKCEKCNEVMRIRLKKYRTDNKEHWNQRKRESERNIRNRRKEQHLCVECGRKLKPEYKFKTCNECLIKKRRKNNRLYQEKHNVAPRKHWEYIGYCLNCGKETEVYGEKLCKSCRRKAVVNLLEGRKKMDLQKHFWRADNKTLRKVAEK